MKRTLLLLLVIVILATTGCSFNNDIEGTYINGEQLIVEKNSQKEIVTYYDYLLTSDNAGGLTLKSKEITHIAGAIEIVQNNPEIFGEIHALGEVTETTEQPALGEVIETTQQPEIEYEYYKVVGKSMEPTLKDGDFVKIVSKEYADGDIVVAQTNYGMTVVKRYKENQLVSEGTGLTFDLSEVTIIGSVEKVLGETSPEIYRKALAATKQEELDSGMTTLNTNSSIILRGGETYYLSLMGGKGGNGGGGRKTQWYAAGEAGPDYESGYYYTLLSGGGGANGNIKYYMIYPDTDVVINLSTGNAGGTGSGYEVSPKYAGGGGANSLSQGNGSGGTVGNGGGAGGGGGAASIITFGTGSTYRIVGPGGNGGSGSAHYYQYKDGTYSYNYAGGNGGTGGSLSETLLGVPNVTIKSISSAEGSSKVNSPTSSGTVIRKQRKDTGSVIPVTELMNGEHIVLTNTIDGSATIFQKTGDLTFKYIVGATNYNNGSTTYLYWYDFSKYAVSGTTNPLHQAAFLMKVKSDLTFVGGDGSSISPYYPESSGSIGGSSGSGGSSGGLAGSENIEELVSSVYSVTEALGNNIKPEIIFLPNGVNPPNDFELVGGTTDLYKHKTLTNYYIQVIRYTPPSTIRDLNITG